MALVSIIIKKQEARKMGSPLFEIKPESFGDGQTVTKPQSDLTCLFKGPCYKDLEVLPVEIRATR